MYKVGTKARWIGDSGGYWLKGSVYTVIRVDPTVYWMSTEEEGRSGQAGLASQFWSIVPSAPARNLPSWF